MKHSMSRASGVAFATLFALAAPAVANTGAPDPNPDACLKSMKGLGATMGHTHKKDAEGRITYTFQLRTGGHDYHADCDAATGIVGDVRPYFGPQSG